MPNHRSGSDEALDVLSHSVSSRSQAFVHHDPRNLQTEPFRQFFDAYAEPLKLKARDSYDLPGAARR